MNSYSSKKKKKKKKMTGITILLGIKYHFFFPKKPFCFILFLWQKKKTEKRENKWFYLWVGCTTPDEHLGWPQPLSMAGVAPTLDGTCEVAPPPMLWMGWPTTPYPWRRLFFLA
jgi:hypothetical protein